MDHDGLDSLVLEKLLALAKDLHIVIQAIDDADLCSLKVATCIQAHLLLQHDKEWGRLQIECASLLKLRCRIKETGIVGV
ncbi:unnamed protein product [Lampetra planeri]